MVTGEFVLGRALGIFYLATALLYLIKLWRLHRERKV